MDIKEQAKQDYLDGMAMADIAIKYGKSASTIRSWKSRDKWGRSVADKEVVVKNATTPKKSKEKPTHKRNATNATLQHKSATQQENVATQIMSDEAIEKLNESDLRDKHRAFVIEYLKSFNATQAYINVYKVSYNAAKVNASKLLTNTNVQELIKELRKDKLEALAITREDLLADLVKEAKADIGDVVDFGRYNETLVDNNDNPYYDTDGNEIVAHRSWVQVKDKSTVDTSTIKKISQGRDGLNVEMHDRDKARKQLFEQLAELETTDKQERVVIVNDFGGDEDD